MSFRKLFREGLQPVFYAYVLALCVNPLPVQAMSIDWKGLFHLNQNYIRDYSMGNMDSGTGASALPWQGSEASSFMSFSARLQPVVLVNDNLILRSEWMFGRTSLNLFGLQTPSSSRKRNLLTANSDEIKLSASQLWADIHTSFGLIQLGKVTFDWGLGAIFNAASSIMDRYHTGEPTIRLVSKFGNLYFVGFYSKISLGPLVSTEKSLGAGEKVEDDVSDYGIGLKYNNPKKEMEAGALLYRRRASDGQKYFINNGGMDARIINLYVKKSWHKLKAQVEVPIFSGTVPGIDVQGGESEYTATAFIGEVILDLPRWKHTVKVGNIPGQTSGESSKYKAVYLHRNYKISTILFNYNLYNLGYIIRPFDVAITNARYISVGTEKTGIKWSWKASLLYAVASETAKQGENFFLHHKRTFSNGAAVEDQSSSLGMELDFGLSYTLDKNIQFVADLGLFFPGDYFAFDNKAGTEGKTDLVSALVLSTRVRF